MKKIKIGLVEDEIIIAQNITATLEDLGYDCTEAAVSYTEALLMIETDHPDLLLLDIMLAGKKDGIDVATEVRKKYDLPIIFLTANSDAATIVRAKNVSPNAYLIKPFNKDELFAAIEIAMHNFNEKGVENPVPAATKHLRDYVFVKEENTFHKIFLTEILFLESAENYVILHAIQQKKIFVRSTFGSFMEQLPEGIFFRAHRSFAVQTQKIESVSATHVLVAGQNVPLGRVQREELIRLLG